MTTNGAATKKVFRWFWAWNDEKEEQWLGEMARSGWHLVSFSLSGYTFAHGEPGEWVYRTDFQNASTLPRKDLGEYVGLFRDAGWEHVAEYSGWHYFRTRADGTHSTEIFTDTESRIAKYRPLMAALVFFLCILVATNPVLMTRPRPGMSEALKVVYLSANLLRAVAMVVLAVITLRLGLHIRRLRKRLAK